MLNGVLLDDERIRLAVKYALKHYPPVIMNYICNQEEVGFLLSMDKVDKSDVVFYQGVEHFVTLNPECCEVVDNIKGYKPTFWDRYSGSTSAIVKVLKSILKLSLRRKLTSLLSSGLSMWQSPIAEKLGTDIDFDSDKYFREIYD
ncbi:hypothetical protein O5O45_13750 [Hahella aquimaris]|uniref:hypothetical protein n=1 Tax=Hahella sp. HNIBRBA332 TaxID=3015983 RepID=UPI00273B8C10|nr:hypothetical protein [Hahella sp. HNIBRBA332]WLQ16978.1 hypothetical protein O5O45_13750 [Hahella sp. HNIBRBA332]